MHTIRILSFCSVLFFHLQVNAQISSEVKLLHKLTYALNNNDFEGVRLLSPPDSLPLFCPSISHYNYDSNWVKLQRCRFDDFVNNHEGYKIDTLIINDEKKKYENNCDSITFYHTFVNISNVSIDSNNILINPPEKLCFGTLELIRYKNSYYLVNFFVQQSNSTSYSDVFSEAEKKEIYLPLLNDIVTSINKADTLFLQKYLMPKSVYIYRFQTCEQYRDYPILALNTELEKSYKRRIERLKKYYSQIRELLDGENQFQVTKIEDIQDNPYEECFLNEYKFRFILEDQNHAKYSGYFVFENEGGKFYLMKLKIREQSE